MSGLIEEIQRDAIDEGVSVSTLLRKVKLAAAKIDLDEVEEWVASELDGYKDESVPRYRRLVGQPKALNPFNGWIPISGPADFVAQLSNRRIGQSIASLENLAEENNTGTMLVPFPPEWIDAVNNASDVPFGEMASVIASASIVGILDAVRNLVLDWAIRMEKAGITGDGHSFTREEKKRANEEPSLINIGSIGAFAG
ncbi:MAG: AbiTii domain-containing protein, partial [Alphaproteobacteria bacterium]